jgi:hypothetical protein
VVQVLSPPCGMATFKKKDKGSSLPKRFEPTVWDGNALSISLTPLAS